MSTYLIKHVAEQLVFWSNDLGWTDEIDATRFSSQERQALRLPDFGQWHQIDPTCEGMNR
ncbi:MAG: hypothetical protein HKN13_04840 [Rhodothermales bacterium]|nr:hypothetical protein [Rhodothermales bacterium]